MSEALIFASRGTLILGILILGLSLLRIRLIIQELPEGRLHRKWIVLQGFTWGFILGYALYTISWWYQFELIKDLIVPVIFLSGSLFVYLVSRVSLETVKDVRFFTESEMENINDPLTGVFNRRYLNYRFKEELGRCIRYGLPISVLIADIDHFSGINDVHGRVAGDQTLQFLARVLQKQARVSDVVCRFGDDQFAILTTHSDLRAASALAVRLRKAVDEAVLDVLDSKKLPIRLRLTLSIGGAELDPKNPDIPHMLKNAGDAVQKAKRFGGNRIELFIPPH
jgi:diguanylate cyclase (GGDEF)-like protein